MTQGFSVVEQSPACSQKPEPPDCNVTVLSTEQLTRNAVTAEIFCESVFNTHPALFLTQLQREKNVWASPAPILGGRRGQAPYVPS